MFFNCAIITVFFSNTGKEWGLLLKIIFFILDFLRALVLLIIGLYILQLFQESLFGEEVFKQYIILLFIANYLVIFILYRNVLQMKDWSQSSSRKKLPRWLTYFLLVIVLIIYLFVALN